GHPALADGRPGGGTSVLGRHRGGKLGAAGGPRPGQAGRHPGRARGFAAVAAGVGHGGNDGHGFAVGAVGPALAPASGAGHVVALENGDRGRWTEKTTPPVTVHGSPATQLWRNPGSCRTNNPNLP